MNESRHLWALRSNLVNPVNLHNNLIEVNTIPLLVSLLEKKTKSWGNAICPRCVSIWEAGCKSGCSVFCRWIHPLPLKMSVLLFIMWVWRSNGILAFSPLPPCPGPYPPQEELLGSCTALCTLQVHRGGACPGGSSRTRKQQSACYLWVSTPEKRQPRSGAWLTLGPFPQTESDQVFFPRNKCPGVGRVWCLERKAELFS